ncbi:unnamed protein product [Owenia fusiformis]|uniref:CAAX prenyl protease 2 n=1 Tax=Owenia fusiformis TaxID=6347 RepID=A0A8J1XXE1_OWEFU|nr:unnamed protein product [Owenia fusiformis]
MEDVNFEISKFASISGCFVLAIAYVGSLYIWKDTLGRDHSTTIKHRFISVGIVCSIAPIFLWLCSSPAHSDTDKGTSLPQWLGLKMEGLIPASIIPLFLTIILFLGPLGLHYMDGMFHVYKDLEYWKHNWTSLIWLRNHVVAPLSEEFIFRGCMLPLLVPHLGTGKAVFVTPLFFGVAHFHHMMGSIQAGESVQRALLKSAFQFTYTTIFGAYSCFLFLRTGHLVAPTIAHSFCNYMGFPAFDEVLHKRNPAKLILIGLFILGLGSWTYWLYPLTDPNIYSNSLYDL